MIFFALLAVFAAVTATLLSAAITASVSAKEFKKVSTAYMVNEVTSAVSQYKQLNGKNPQIVNATYTTVLQELANTVGFEYLKGYIATSKGGQGLRTRDIVAIYTTPDYSSSTTLLNSSYAMQQAIVVGDSNYSTDLSTYTSAANNKNSTVKGCKSDSKDITTSDSYCPYAVGTYYTRVGSDSYNYISYAADKLKAISDKFEPVYKNSATVPGTTGSTVTLNSVVSTANGGANPTVPASCVGTFNYSMVPLSCADLYFGTNQVISYTKLAANQIRLTVSNYYYDKNKTLQPYSFVRTF